MSSRASVQPMGAVPTCAVAPRASELRKMRLSLTRPDTDSFKESDTNTSPKEKVEMSPTSDLRQFTEPDALSNMVLVVEDTELHVHKEILAGWSPVFMAMFSGKFAETENNRVVMHGKSLEDVQLLLNCLYPPNLHTVTAENVMQLLALANEYDISALKNKCEDVLLAQEPSLDILLIAHEYNLTRVLEKTKERCASLPMSAIDHRKNNELTDHIPSEHLLDIYKEKIALQSVKLKAYKSMKSALDSLQADIQRWGTARNSYPCDKDRVFNDRCVQCLQNLRDYTITELRSL